MGCMNKFKRRKMTNHFLYDVCEPRHHLVIYFSAAAAAAAVKIVFR